MTDSISQSFDVENNLLMKNEEKVAYSKHHRVQRAKSWTSKYFSLLALVIQTVMVVTTMRYSRLASSSKEGVMYLTTTAVFFSEVMKFAGSFVLVFLENDWNVRGVLEKTHGYILAQPTETLKVGVPALLYTLQNNLIFVALSNISASAYQVTYQLKILTTAILSVLILHKKISCTKWMCLICLTLGVTLAEWPTGSRQDDLDMIHSVKRTHFFGIVCVLLSCITSGLAGVYFEKILKRTTTSIWYRNVQLAFFSSLLSLLAVFWKDFEAVRLNGLFQGYNLTVWLVIALQGLGGLIVAAVLKYADNILKCFANAVALVISYLIGIFVLQDASLQIHFMLGSFLVIVSSFVYSLKDKIP